MPAVHGTAAATLRRAGAQGAGTGPAGTPLITSPRSPARATPQRVRREHPPIRGCSPTEKPPPGSAERAAGGAGDGPGPRSPPRPAARAPPQEPPPWPCGARPPPPCLPTPRPAPRPRLRPVPRSASDWRAGFRLRPPGGRWRLPIGSRSAPRLETRAARAA